MEYETHENTGTDEDKIQQDIVRDEGDSRNSRIAVILLWVAVICSILLVILAIRLISDPVSRMISFIKESDLESAEYESETEYDPDIDYDLDLDSKKFDVDIDVDKILSQFDAEEFEEALSRDIEKMQSEKNGAASVSGEGIPILDFCDNKKLDEFADDLENRDVSLFIYKDGTWYDTSDKEDILKAFNAIKTVKIGEEVTDYEDSEWVQIDFFDGGTETSWAFDFWDGCLEWKKDGHYNMYKVVDWGDLDGLRLESMGITL